MQNTMATHELACIIDSDVWIIFVDFIAHNDCVKYLFGCYYKFLISDFALSNLCLNSRKYKHLIISIHVCKIYMLINENVDAFNVGKAMLLLQTHRQY